jgi:hypothetical protein
MIGPQVYHPNIVAMRNFYIEKGSKNGKARLNLVLDYAKFGDLSKVNQFTITNLVVFKMPSDF